MTSTLITEEARILGLTDEQAQAELDACAEFGQAAERQYGSEAQLTLDERNRMGW